MAVDKIRTYNKTNTLSIFEDSTSTTIKYHLLYNHKDKHINMAHQDRLANTHILIFGGTSGMGFAVANMSLSRGARVTISGSAQPKVDDKVKLLQSYYPNMDPSHVRGFASDLAQEEKLEENLKIVLDKATENGTKKLDHVVYTAGGPGDLPKVSDVTLESALKPMVMRLGGPALLAKLISGGQYMPLSDSSSLTVTGGTNTYKPLPGWTYAASAGGGLDGLVRGLAVDLKPLRVNCVVPGAIQTELLQKWMESLGEEGTQKMKESMSLAATLGQPEDIAEAYGYLMRDRFATASFVASDGGRLLV
jgi:NAD(P)-dependent dehydrogenase (short-subunit alcohol dehydrogenase family)